MFAYNAHPKVSHKVVAECTSSPPGRSKQSLHVRQDYPLLDHVTAACPQIRQADVWILTTKRHAQSIQDRKCRWQRNHQKKKGFLWKGGV